MLVTVVVVRNLDLIHVGSVAERTCWLLGNNLGHSPCFFCWRPLSGKELTWNISNCLKLLGYVILLPE